MDQELFRSLVKQLKGRVNLLCFHVMGEPLYHPDFGEFVKICAEEAQAVSIVTNGMLLNTNNREYLLDPTVYQVNFSLQSFLDNFPLADGVTYLQNILDFVELAQQKRPDLHINLRLWNEGHDEKTIAHNKGILKAIAEYLKMDFEELAQLSLKGHRLKGNIFLNLSERFEWPELDSPFLSQTGTCKALKNTFAILSDGKVVPCCFDKEGVIDLGSCRKLSLAEILSGDRAQNLRQGFSDHRLVEELCQKCSYRERFG